MKDRIIKYINEEETDYAIMIAGEWGVGKTYYIKNSLKKELENESKRMVYVSLIGIDSDEKLEWKIYSQINPFYKSKKSEIAIEAEHMEQLVTKENKQKLIPKNVVLVMDDLERINPDYLEAAMGYLNVFIEHDNAKCIFVCNEKKIEEIKTDYKTIKEKYIRHTYFIEEEFKESAKEIIENKSKAFVCVDEIIKIFEKGQHLNLRTLLYALYVFSEVIENIKSMKLDYKSKRNEVLHYILSYICFYSIEKNKGTDVNLLNQIIIKNYAQSTLDRYKEQVKRDKNNSNNNDENKIEENKLDNDKVKETINSIQKTYFEKNSIKFHYFGSIALYITKGKFSSAQEMQDDINLLVYLLNIETPKYKVEQIENLHTLSNKKYKKTINELVEIAEKGGMSLRLIRDLYYQIYWFGKNNLEGLNTKNLIQRLSNITEESFQNSNIKYDSHLDNQLQFDLSKDEEMENFDFIKNLMKINKQLREKNNRDSISKLISYINDGNVRAITNMLTKDYNYNIRLYPEIADIIISELKKADTLAVVAFTMSLSERYKGETNTPFGIEHITYESDFIKTLYNLLQKDEKLLESTPKSMSDYNLVLLKKELYKIIKNRV